MLSPYSPFGFGNRALVSATAQVTLRQCYQPKVNRHGGASLLSVSNGLCGSRQGLEPSGHAC